MGIGMLRRYHANAPGDVEAAPEAQDVTETPGGTVEADPAGQPPSPDPEPEPEPETPPVDPPAPKKTSSRSK